ncbi:MAG: hypothetical protein A2086_03645 [Spirochaetes bacterium GWD1_27_9]|nr:MAG: hypothetical protein A2Z98_10330 [Spirochaetes bacterium GWB1_27_13]OHD25455.1 MAG: hypothetical protein A2Y34_17720 [Spirochaetes bacterium GWC1_27_15]OHD44384.1 MAG: hypothetical protein A2086_03645 [Spirochaetes bacterium GWD1_27_9]
MNNELYNFIRKNISEISGIPENEIKDNSNFQDDLDMDSLESVEILHRIEKNYKIKIKNVELEEIQTLKDIYNACEKLIYG